MRIALALLMITHSIAHLMGFVVPWQLMNLSDAPYRTTILRGVLILGYRHPLLCLRLASARHRVRHPGGRCPRSSAVVVPWLPTRRRRILALPRNRLALNPGRIAH